MGLSPHSTTLAVELREVIKRFPNPGGGEVFAVDSVSLQIEHGEFFSLLGPSGCGKTTSLRMIAGFEWPTAGEIWINGQPVGHKPPFQRPVNTVFQNYALFQHMTVGQNIAFGLEMEKVSKAEAQRRVADALDMVQLSGLANRKPKQLSGGQQQRVALARALVKRPTVLLLDEPLGALDQKLRKDMQFELKSLQEKVGITFIYVTHDQGEALSMSDRIAVMNKGRVLQVGTPVEIYERPASRFVADFIGESNFLRGKVSRISGSQVCVLLEGSSFELTGLCRQPLALGDLVDISIRPEKVRLTDGKPINENVLPARVIHTTYIGSDTHLLIEAGQGMRLKVWEQNRISTLDPRAFYSPGQEVWASLFPDNILVMPLES